MPIIKEDFIGKYFFKRAFVFRPAENESSYPIGSKVDGKFKTFLGNAVSGIIGDENWVASGTSSSYQGLEEAFKQGLIDEAEWKKLLCHQLYYIITLPSYVQFGDAEWNSFRCGGDHKACKKALDAWHRLSVRLQYLVAVAMGHHLQKYEHKNYKKYKGLKTLLVEPKIPLNAEIRKPAHLRNK